jgi:hypothetical protein
MCQENEYVREAATSVASQYLHVLVRRVVQHLDHCVSLSMLLLDRVLVAVNLALYIIIQKCA